MSIPEKNTDKITDSKSYPQLEEDRVIKSTELAEELSREEPQQSFSTGMFHLDKMTNGIKEGDLVILSGLTGNGKTELAVTLAKNFIKNNAPVLFFSYEISPQELYERFGVDGPVYHIPRVIKNGSPAWIDNKIIEAQNKFGVKIVFIDHLHYLIGMNDTRAKNTAEMLGWMCREFKQIARNRKIVIVLLAHVRKFDSSRPTMQDIKDSSGIMQEADTIMIIHRSGKKRSRKTAQAEDLDEPYELDNKAILYLDKVRRRGGRQGKIDMEFNGSEYKEALA